MMVWRYLGAYGLILAFWMIIPVRPAAAVADEVDQMLNVENSVRKNANQGEGISVGPAEMPAEAPVVQPAKPAIPVAVPKPIPAQKKVQAPVQPPKKIGTVKPVPPSPVKPSPAVVKAVDKAVPASLPEHAAVIPPEPGLAALRIELIHREVELAKAHKEIERLKDIVKRIQEASRRESLVVHYNKAGIYRASMMYKKAEEEYLAALAIDPEDAGVHYNLAILYDDNFKDRKKAKFHYERFLELAPDDADVPKVREWLSSIIVK